MKILLPAGLACMAVVLLLAAGCTMPAQPQPAPVPVTVTTEVPIVVTTSMPTLMTPVPAMIAPASPLPATIRDTPLLFTISSPAGYAGTTIRAKTSDYSILYKTTVFNPAVSGANVTADDNSGVYRQLADSLTIFSYSSSLSVDQNIRDIIRNAGAAFTESTAGYGGITYTRFDVVNDPYDGTPGETVIFVGDKASANENGYLPVLIYTITPGGTVNNATFEKMVQSFRYYTGRKITDAPGTETERPPFFQ
jgi:hypothetical protein